LFFPVSSLSDGTKLYSTKYPARDDSVKEKVSRNFDREGEKLIPHEDIELFQGTWQTTRNNHGFDFTFYLPGIIRYGLERGRYPAILITGDECELMCKHCMSQLLKPMIKVTETAELIRDVTG
jgi:hypothetical protein